MQSKKNTPTESKSSHKLEAAAPSRRIVSAAMLMKDDLIVPGVRHFSMEMRAVLHRIYGEDYHTKVKEQGFIDTHGNFLSREDAWKRAELTNQILRDTGKYGMLFSENLY
jgi:hypothetical protein